AYKPQPISEALAREGQPAKVAGRIVANRSMGKAAFLNLQDGSGRIQVYVKKDAVGEQAFQVYKLLDIGDLLGCEGPVFRTKTGEITVHVEKLTLLAKSLLPLPEKWHGLKDVEVRYRQRYLDLVSNEDARKIFQSRVRIVRFIRNFLDSRGYLEVETPMMHSIAGGATARPFVTHHNTLDMDLYLRVAPELYLKRLLVGGLEKVYEINRNFRNEGISTRHNPEFTMMELYHAYIDYHGIMDLVEELVSSLAVEITGGTRIRFGELELELARPWPRTPYRQLLREHAGTDDPKRLVETAGRLGIETAGRSEGAIVNDVYEKLVEPKLKGPVFVTEYPKAISPLAKQKPEDPAVCERFEMFMAGMEIANAFTELNDALDQRERFVRQLEEKAEGMEKLDEEFLTALEHGMPPAGGLGVGIDRLTMLMTNQASIREVILFPLLRKHAPGEEGAAAERPAE
ncbi:MAG TPA: lysine--tRNA ligase, partial [Planctomycetota bacterium]|nr:lysine--tRNA ligase [Planctomycetota bacterium]